MPKPTLEQLIVKRFHKACSEYQLIQDGDHVLVALSGGKDSLCLLELMARQASIFRPSFRVEAVHVRMKNIRYETDTTYLENFCRERGVVLHVVNAEFSTGEHAVEANSQKTNLRKQKTPCFLCSWNRRKQIFNLAQELGCNKIAFGHHMDDILHTTLMNQFFQGRFEGMPVKLKMKKMPLTIIRPLCLCHEADIAALARERQYQKQRKLCPYEHETHRQDVADIFRKAESVNPEARFCLWRALESEGKLVENQ